MNLSPAKSPSLKKHLRNLFEILRNNYTFLHVKLFSSSAGGNKIVLVPPTDLVGSFGDELMVATFVSQFPDNRIIIYSNKKVIRDDFLLTYKNVEYKKWQKYPKFLSECSEVHVLGADNMDGGYGDKYPLQKLALLQLAHRLGLKTSIKGFSVNKTMSIAVKQKMQAGSKYNVYNLRDIDSYERASKFLPTTSIRQTADTAFLCPLIPLNDKPYENWIKDQHAKSRLVVAICPNAIQAKKIGLDSYLEGLGEALQVFSQYRPCSFVFLYHDLRDHCDGLSDKDISEKLFEKLHRIESCYYVDDVTNGVTLKSYLKNVDCTFTGRMHFGISGLSLKKPMLSISYQDKFTGLMKLFGIDATHSVVEYTSLHQAGSKVTDFLEHFSEMQALVNENLDYVKKLSKVNFL